MNILVIGSGGREHAIIKKLKEDTRVDKLYCAPGNGGMVNDCQIVNEIGALDFDAQIDFCKANQIDYVVVTPDDPLYLGGVDKLEAAGFKCFGPKANAALIEGSKAFAKDLMKKYNIPTAKYETFSDTKSAYAYIDENGAPIVIKADGLALGKGVVIALTVNEAKTAVKEMLEDSKFGNAGKTVVIEEYLEGPEVSVLCFADGKTLKPMVSSQDHKRAFDNDLGLNTGGMGTVAPNPYYTKEVADRSLKEIFMPTLEAMRQEGREFKGCLYFSLMLTKDGPKVIEYNARFGDPETQVVLPLMKTSLLDAMLATTDGTLSETNVEFEDKSCCCVVMASKGYPLAYEKGYEITFENNVEENVYVAGAKIKDGKLVTNGGRVLGVIGKSDTLKEAIDLAYKRVEDVKFDNAFYRSDIGKRALEVK